MIDDIGAQLPHILTLLVVLVALPLTWTVTWLLWRLTRADPGGAALRRMTGLSAAVALIVTVFVLVFVNNGMNDPVLNSWQTMVLTRGALLVLSVIPTLYWLHWYRNGGPKP